MTLNLGMVRPGSTILVPFHTFTSDDPTASVAIADFALADIGIYKALSMTERLSTTGVVLLETDGIDLDGAVGIGGFSIDLSSNATAGFYSAGSHYYVTVGPVTIDGATVNFVAATFSIGFPDAIINTTVASATSDTQFILTDGPAEADVLIGCPILIQAVASAVGVGIQMGHISDYIVTTKEVFLSIDPGGGTVTAVDHVSIFMKVTGIYDQLLTGATHNITNSAGRIIRQLQQSGGYENGQVWIDTLDGAAGTTAHENGTMNNPVLTIGDAKTIAVDSIVNLSDFHVINGSTITLGETSDNESYFGDNWTLVLNSQSCASSHFEGAHVSGIQTGSGMGLHGGSIGTITLADDAHLDDVALEAGTITLPSSGSVAFARCTHAAATLPILDFNAGAVTVHMHGYGGGIEVQNMDASDILHLDGNGRLDINANCTDAVVNVRGNWDINDSGTTSNITKDDDSSNIALILADTGTDGVLVSAGTGAGQIDLTSGTVDVGALQANVITAASINAAAMNGKGDWNIGKTGYTAAPTAGSIATGSFAAGAIDAAAIGTNAIDADSLAADAIAEIRDAILPKINTALDDIPFVMVLSSDHVTPATGLVPVATRSIDGGTSFSATTGTVAEAASGLYHFDASAADMNGALITFKFAVATADDTFVSIRTGG